MSKEKDWEQLITIAVEQTGMFLGNYEKDIFRTALTLIDRNIKRHPKYDRLEKAADKLRNDFQSLYMDSCDGYFRRTGEQIIAEFDEAIKGDENVFG